MKKLFSLALMTAACGAAQADVGLYGLFDVSYGKAINTSAAGDKATFHAGGDNGNNEGNSTSRFGIKGENDVGGGVKANFRLESNGITSSGQVNGITNGSGQFFNRKAWFGLSGSFGEFRVGREDNIPFQAFINYDLNGASNGVSSAAYTGAAWLTRGRQAHQLHYIAPTMGGLKVQAGYVPQDSGTLNSKANVGLAGTYDIGKASVSVGYESKRTTTDTNYTGAAGSYDFGIAKLAVNYHNGGKGAKSVNIGGQVNLSGTTVGAQFGKNSDSKATAYEVFVNREVFKSTYGYVEAGSLDNKTTPIAGTKTKATGYAAGLIYVF